MQVAESSKIKGKGRNWVAIAVERARAELLASMNGRRKAERRSFISIADVAYEINTSRESLMRWKRAGHITGVGAPAAQRLSKLSGISLGLLLFGHD